MARKNRTKEAIELLREGITKVPPQLNLHVLYQACAELMARENRTGEAIELLRAGITKIPPQFGLSSLYQACAELMARQNRTGEAIELLREGITNILPQFNVFTLYQACAELMARENRIADAIELLREGIVKVPPHLNGYRLAESVLYLAIAGGNHELLEKLAAGGTPVLGAQQRALAAVLLLQTRGDWVGAAKEARRARSQHPTYMALCAQEAFSWLAAKQAEQAQSALDRFPLRAEYARAGPTTWLVSFVALAAGRQELARQLYLTYVGEGSQAPAELTEYHLLQQWNSPIPMSTPHPGYYLADPAPFTQRTRSSSETGPDL